MNTMDALMSIFKKTLKKGSKVNFNNEEFVCTESYTTNYGDKALEFVSSRDINKVVQVEYFNENSCSPNYTGQPFSMSMINY